MCYFKQSVNSVFYRCFILEFSQERVILLHDGNLSVSVFVDCEWMAMTFKR